MNEESNEFFYEMRLEEFELNKILVLLRENYNTILAVKIVKRAMGLNLKDSLEYVQNLQKDEYI